MSVDYTPLNEAVQVWGIKNRYAMQATGRAMGIQHVTRSPSKGESIKKIREKFGYDRSGAVNRVSFSNINRSLIYTTQGAGKGRGGAIGSRWIDKYGNRKSTNPKSLGKMGTEGRTEKPFIDTTLDGPDGTEKLADIVAENQADAIIRSVIVK